MPVDFVVKWVPADGTSALTFSGLYDIEGFDQDEIRWSIPTAESGDDGAFAQDGTAEPRNVGFGGLLNGLEASTTDATALRDLLDTLQGRICGGKLGKLYKNSDRYINCRCNSFIRDEDKSYSHLNWTASFFAHDPFWYNETPSSQSVATSGTTALTIGGNVPIKPSLSIVVTGIGTGGAITVTHTTTTGISEAFTLAPTATGTYVIDMTAGTVLRGTNDSIAQFSGSFFEQVLPSGSSLTVATANGATISGITANWRQRFYGA